MRVRKMVSSEVVRQKENPIRRYKEKYKRLYSLLKNDSVLWKKISGFPGYFINHRAEIASIKLDSGRRSISLNIIAQSKWKYFQVNLSKNKKSRSYKLHRIMAMTYLPKPLEGQTIVRHLNSDRYDNRIENLAWGTPKDNSLDQYVNGVYVRCPMKINSLGFYNQPVNDGIEEEV